MKNKKTLLITQGGLIAAIYVVITVLCEPFSFGEVQLRISECLMVLPIFTPAAVPGLFLGCLIANLICGAPIWDVIFGSLATLIGVIFTRKLRDKNMIVALLPPVISNALIIPFLLKYAYGVPLPVPFMMLTVGAGEAVSAGVFGFLLGKLLEKHKKTIFGLD